MAIVMQNDHAVFKLILASITKSPKQCNVLSRLSTIPTGVVFFSDVMRTYAFLCVFDTIGRIFPVTAFVQSLRLIVGLVAIFQVSRTLS